jgi:membrane fusion protein (multidrug efflux system)
MPNNKKKKIFLALGTVVVIIVAYFLYEHFVYVTTDDAYVQAHTELLSARVAAIVDTVNVDENQKVKAGDLLVHLDDHDYISRFAQAQADVASLQAKAADAERSYNRINKLYKKDAVSQQQYEDAEFSFKELDQKLVSAKAQADLAKLNLDYTKITAPSDGIIAKKAVEKGAFVGVGTPLLGFVQAKERWVVANYKETDLAGIHVGSSATVEVDAIPDKKFGGTVESISPSTGATFALLPPDNATGNFTKVVQRVPVRVKLSDLSPEDVDRLQAGLSAYVSIKK